MFPILHDVGLFGLLIPSPKRNDLHGDSRYAMHCYPPDDNASSSSLSVRCSRRLPEPGTRTSSPGTERDLASRLPLAVPLLASEMSDGASSLSPSDDKIDLT